MGLVLRDGYIILTKLARRLGRGENNVIFADCCYGGNEGDGHVQRVEPVLALNDIKACACRVLFAELERSS